MAGFEQRLAGFGQLLAGFGHFSAGFDRHISFFRPNWNRYGSISVGKGWVWLGRRCLDGYGDSDGRIVTADDDVHADGELMHVYGGKGVLGGGGGLMAEPFDAGDCRSGGDFAVRCWGVGLTGGDGYPSVAFPDHEVTN